MNRHRFWTLFTVLVLSSCWAAGAAAQTREFTSADGRKLTAKLTGFAAGQAQLELADGRTVNVPLLTLSEPDREYVDLWATHPSRIVKQPKPGPKPAGRSAPVDYYFIEDHLIGSGYDMTLYNDDKYVMIIEIVINERPYKFQVNTGLPYSYIDDPLADVFGMQTKQINTVLAGGVGVSEGELKNFKIGNTVFPSRVFRVTRLAETGLKNHGVPIDGVLGFDFLRELGAIVEYHKGDPKALPDDIKRLYFLRPASAGS